MQKEILRKCSKCSETKVLSEFWIDKSKKDQHNTYCKQCAVKKKKEHYEKNKDKILKKNKEYKEKNKDKISNRHKEHYEKNKDKILNRHKEHYEKNKDKILKIKHDSNFQTTLKSIGAGNYHTRWSTEEETSLLLMKNSGMTFKQISLILKRTHYACRYKYHNINEGEL